MDSIGVSYDEGGPMEPVAFIRRINYKSIQCLTRKLTKQEIGQLNGWYFVLYLCSK